MEGVTWSDYKLILSVRAHVGFDRGALLSFRRTIWANDIVAGGSRNNKSFRVMDDQWWKLAGRALHHSFAAFAKIQNVHPAIGRVLNWRGEPMTPCLNKFTFVKPSALFPPARALGNRGNSIDQIFLNPSRCPVPLDVAKAMMEVNRSRSAVHAKPSPVPHFESKDIRRRADLKHHAVLPRAVRGSGRDQKVVVLLGGKPVNVFVGIKLNCSFLCLQQVSYHLPAINILLQA